MTKLTKEQFRAQFKYGPIRFTNFTPIYSETFHGYKLFRALNDLVLQDTDGEFYSGRKA